MTGTQLCTKSSILRQRQQTACGYHPVASYNRRSIMQGSIGNKDIHHERGCNQSIYSNAGINNLIDANIPLQNQQSTDFLGRHTEYGLVNLINQTVSLLCVQMNSRTQEPALTYTLQGSTQFWQKNNRQSHKQEIYAFGEKPINSMKLQNICRQCNTHHNKKSLGQGNGSGIFQHFIGFVQNNSNQ